MSKCQGGCNRTLTGPGYCSYCGGQRSWVASQLNVVKGYQQPVADLNDSVTACWCALCRLGANGFYDLDPSKKTVVYVLSGLTVVAGIVMVLLSYFVCRCDGLKYPGFILAIGIPLVAMTFCCLLWGKPAKRTAVAAEKRPLVAPWPSGPAPLPPSV